MPLYQVSTPDDESEGCVVVVYAKNRKAAYREALSFLADAGDYVQNDIKLRQLPYSLGDKRAHDLQETDSLAVYIRSKRKRDAKSSRVTKRNRRNIIRR